MTTYELLKTLHVLAAVVWVGGAVTLQLFAMRAQGSDDPMRLAGFAKDAEWVGTRVFIPASLLLVVLGVWMVIDSWSFGQTWILLGIGGYGFSFLVGSFFLGPESGRIGKMMDERGPADGEVMARIQRIFLVSRVEMFVLLFVVAVMVFKPGA